MTARRLAVLAVAVLWAAVVPDASAITRSVSINNFAFSPASITVDAGDDVVWTNDDGVTHTVTADDAAFDSGNIAAGDAFTHRFPAAGVFTYHCDIHGNMRGSVTVRAQPVTTTATTAAPTTTRPPTTTAAPATTTSAPSTSTTSTSTPATILTVVSTSSSSSSTSFPLLTTPTTEADGDDDDDDGPSAGMLALLAALVVALGAAAWWLTRMWRQGRL